MEELSLVRLKGGTREPGEETAKGKGKGKGKVTEQGLPKNSHLPRTKPVSGQQGAGALASEPLLPLPNLVV